MSRLLLLSVLSACLWWTSQAGPALKVALLLSAWLLLAGGMEWCALFRATYAHTLRS